MRAIVVAVALACASPALAQQGTGAPLPPNCTGYARVPTLPDGARASHGAMTAGGQTLDTWRRDREAKMALCLADINTLRAQLNAMEQAYNELGVERNNAIDAWNNEVAEFSARSGSRDRGGVLTRPDR